VGAFSEPGQAAVGFDEVVAVALGVGRGEADAFEAIDVIDRLEELYEGDLPSRTGISPRP